MKLLIRILANSGAILIASRIVPGFVFDGNLSDLFIAGAILGVINALIKPLIELIALPAIFLTLGLFYIVINVSLFVLAAKFIPHLSVQDITAAFWGVIIVSLTNNLLSHLTRKGDTNNY